MRSTMRYGRGSTMTFLLLPPEWITESVERRAVTGSGCVSGLKHPPESSEKGNVNVAVVAKYKR